jgi:uncharacterized C2H2 Zn-finger protein
MITGELGAPENTCPICTAAFPKKKQFTRHME